jgi:hypothetical protein
MSARGLALVAEATGETGRTFELLTAARARCNRLADPYVWLDVDILDAQCDLGRRHGHPRTNLWADTMRQLETGHHSGTPRPNDPAKGGNRWHA